MAGEWLRDTQTVIEVGDESSAPALRDTQTVIEVGALTTQDKLRITQVVVEVGVLEFTCQITGTPTSGTKPLSVQFSAVVTGGTPTGYEWDFGDQTVSTEAAPLHVYATAGTYSVRLVVHTAQGDMTCERLNYITVSNPAAISSATAQIWIDWENNGFGLGGTSDFELARMLPQGTSPNDDITADVKKVTWQRGTSGPETLGQTPPGTATIIVKNESGKYTPENTSSPLYGFLEPGRRVWIGALANTGVTFPIFAGVLEEIVPLPGTGIRDCQLIVKDPFGVWAETPARVPFSRTRTARQYREALLDAIGEPSSRRSLADEPDGLGVSGADTKSVLRELEELNEAVATRHWIQPAPNKDDWFFYRTLNRGQNLGTDAPVDSLDQDDLLHPGMTGYRKTLRTVTNVQRVAYHPFEFGNPETVWEGPVPIQIDSDHTVTIIGRHGTATSRGVRPPPIEREAEFRQWVDQAALVVSSTVPLTVSQLVNYGRSAEITLAAQTTGIVTALSITGRLATEGGQQSVELKDEISQDRYQVTRAGQPVDSDFVGSEALARAVVEWLLARGANPRPRPEVQLRNLVAKGLPRDLYDVVSQTVAELSISARRYEIIGIRGTIRDGGLIYEWTWTYQETLFQSAQGLFKLDSSQLDGSDVLSF